VKIKLRGQCLVCDSHVQVALTGEGPAWFARAEHIEPAWIISYLNKAFGGLWKYRKKTYFDWICLECLKTKGDTAKVAKLRDTVFNART